MRTITITSPEQIKSVLWLIKAMSENDRRPGICCIHIKGDAAVATDGRRMHIWTMPAPQPLPAGNWVVVSKSKNLIILSESDVVYPDWQSVVPRAHSSTVTISRITEWTHSGHILLVTNTLFDLEFLVDGLGFGTLRAKRRPVDGVKITFNKPQQGHGSEAICIYPEQDKQVILMPLRLGRQ